MGVTNGSIMTGVTVGLLATFIVGIVMLELTKYPEESLVGMHPETSDDNRRLQGDTDFARLSTDQGVIDYINTNIVPDNIRDNLRFLTSTPHVAGTEAEVATAKWVADTWTDQGLQDVHILSYDALLSYPNSEKPNIVRLISSVTGKILFESSPHQAPLYAPEESSPDVSDNYNAFSPPGIAKGGLVYANYGRSSDFLELQELGVALDNMIVIARYGKVFRANIVRSAEEFGASGVILYSDPEDYAPDSCGVYPNTVMMPPTAVAFGTVKNFHGDSMTPFYPSVDSAYRIPEEEWNLPHIPVQPLSYGDAYHILKSLSGPEAPESWQGGLNITYHIGPNLIRGQTLILEVHTTHTPGTVHDVIATIEGSEESDRYVLIGNHRDAWVFGAIDPSSGTAAMMEASRVLMSLHNETGWRPRRTLVFCSWAAEEFGMIGSTEWTEQFGKQLSARAVAYLNIDQAFNGNYSFRAKSTPLMYDLLWEVTKQVPNPDPEEVAAGRTTVFDTWLERLYDLDHPERPWINSIASGSDFSPFQQVLGVPCLDIRYTDMTIGEPLYHTLYETFELVDELYDRGFLFHSSVTAVWSILAVTIADLQLLPFTPARYPAYLETGIEELQTEYGDLMAAQNLSFSRLSQATDKFSDDVNNFVAELESIDLSNVLETRRANDRLMMIERAFLDPRGLPDRPHYLHVVTSPSDFNTYSGSAFSGLSDTLYRISVTDDLQELASLWRTVEQHLAAVTHFVYTAGRVLSDQLW